MTGAIDALLDELLPSCDCKLGRCAGYYQCGDEQGVDEGI